MTRGLTDPSSDVRSTKASRECAQALVQRLEEILVSPDAVPLEDLPTFLLALASIQTTVSARLLTARRPVTPEPDRLLTVAEAAQILEVTPKWLYRHADRLPFTRRLSRKALRFSEAGLRKWLATRR